MKVAVVVFDGVFDSGLTSILDVLDNANALGGQIHDPPTWNVTMVGSTPQVRTGAGLLVSPQPLERAQTADLLVVPGLAGTSPEALLDHVGGDVSLPVRNLIARTRDRGTTIASACAGSFFLAEAGILEGVRATTTWWLSPTFRARYPRVHLDHSQMVITNEGITTAGAAFGHVDLALAIVRASSPALADLVARYLVIDERPSQAAYTIPSALAQSDPTVAAFERWIREHLDETISLRDAAKRHRRQRTDPATLRAAHHRNVPHPIRPGPENRTRQPPAAHHRPVPGGHLRKVGYKQPNTLRILLRERTGKTTSSLRGR